MRGFSPVLSRCWAFLLLSLVAVGIFVSSASAQNSGRRVAFVVGNSTYQNVPELKNPLNDAQGISEALRRAGFEVVSANNLDRVSFESELRKFIQSLDGADLSLFYYSGHGIQVGGDNRLIPVDAALKTAMDLEVETISIRTILNSMQTQSREQIIFLDSCRNNPFPARAYYVGAELTRAEQPGGLAVQQTSSGSLIAFSTQPGNVAEDGAGLYSPFTGAFLDNGFKLGVDLQTALMKVTREVSDKTGGRQVPWNNSSLTEPVYLARPSITIAAADEATEEPAAQAQTATKVEPAAPAVTDHDLANDVAKLITVAFEKPAAVPIGVGAVAVLANFPLLRGEPGVQIALAKAPSSGVLYLNSEPLTEGSVLKPTNLPEVKYEPSLGTEGATIPVEWQVSDASRSTAAPIQGQLAPYVVDCDREAGEPLDLQGVAKGKLPNEIDPATAIPACETAVTQFPNVVRYKYELGRAKLAARDIAPAATLFQQAADEGHTRALYQLGNLAARGLGREQNLADAEQYYQRGADLGDPYAMAAHGRNLVQGQGIAPDPALGVKFLNRAVELGHTYAMNTLGAMYYYGQVVDKNPERGVRFWQAGLARGDIYSMNNLGIASLEGAGIKKDLKKALRYFTGASDGGHPGAPNNIGRMYFNGNGVKKDVGEAIRWYDLGAQRGDTWAASNLAWVYASGPKNLKDSDKSVSYYALAAALDVYGDNPEAASRLKALSDDAKAREIKRLIAEIGSAEGATSTTLDGTLLILERKAWEAHNPRQDLF
jgi:TPR repeat protein